MSFCPISEIVLKEAKLSAYRGLIILKTERDFLNLDWAIDRTILNKGWGVDSLKVGIPLRFPCLGLVCIEYDKNTAKAYAERTFIYEDALSYLANKVAYELSHNSCTILDIED